MRSDWLTGPKVMIFAPVLLLLMVAVACGGTAAEPVIVEKEVIREVIKEVPVIKEVIKEVVKEVIVVATMQPAAVREKASAGTKSGTAGAQARAIPAGKRGGHINMVQYADVRQRLIHQSSVLNMNMAPLFNNLVEYNPETAEPSDIRCDLCTSWELAEDGMTYTFHIAPDATWSDGVAVTAKDVVFSLESMVNPDQFPAIKGRSTSTHCNTGLYYDSGMSRAIDPKTVEVVINFPAGGFFPAIANHTCVLIAEHVVVGQGIPQGGKDMDALVTSGPFRFVEFEKEVSVEYVRNPDYFKEGLPYIDSMKHFVMADSGRVIAAFKAGQVLTSNQSLDNLSPIEADQLDKEMDNLTMHWAGPISMLYLLMNTSKAPFDQPEVRRAAQLAMDRDAVIQTISGGRYARGYPLPPGFWYSHDDETYANWPGFRTGADGGKHPDDIAEARALLSKVGMTGPQKLTLTARNCCDYPDAAVLLKQQLEEALGWEITLKIMESGAGFDAYWAGDYQFAVQGGSIFMNDPDAIFARDIRGTTPQWVGGGRGKYYAPPGMEELFDKQVREPDQDKRIALVQEMSMLRTQFTGNPYVYWVDRHHGVEDRIQNFNFTYQGSRWEHIWCDPACN